jgi:hypothetical protein
LWLCVRSCGRVILAARLAAEPVRLLCTAGHHQLLRSGEHGPAHPPRQGGWAGTLRSGCGRCAVRRRLRVHQTHRAARQRAANIH